ncbi:MAG: 2-oxoglutarate dehydrogenase, E2 component, dihydrolipoamide succinyltransferase [Actinomycetota bacterium]|nr:2-oxoglutarate dehydrogenase, E2 component, dihydrolipoamide succinyltransferase [Actinomycetota bacterium]MDH5312392.1 2-oxoglutarate dehydrogenase, E2 component, dihydrolipoamide succinyltransferase [Actinomycetota bacterium]
MTSIQMPQLGETIIEGTILKWLKAEGESIERDEPLFEISTDKVDTEVPSPVAGTLTKIIVAEGETVPVGTELAEIASEEDAAPAAASATTAPSEPSASGSSGGLGHDAADQDASDAVAAPPSASPSPSGAAATAVDRGPRSQILSPLVRKLAQEHGLDLSTIAGTGTGGRITKADVMGIVASGGGQAPPAAAPHAGAVSVTPPSVTTAASQGEAIEPISHIRRAIATHMLASVNETARAWTMVEINVDHLVKLRERSKDAFLATHGVKLTYLPFVVRATVDALKAYPMVNSRIDGDDIVTPRAVHMGIAVSYDAGLIVPVIRDVDVMNSVGIARAVGDLAARARSHQLKPDEVQGATFTITNPGPYGSLVSVPIINQPNAGILSLDSIQRRPVVIEGDAIAVRSMVYVSMSWDHRLLDGEIATRFLARVKQNLESWDFAEDLGV